MSRRMEIDTSSWGPFDPENPSDAMCERVAFTEYTLKRLRKLPKTGSDEASIWIGGVMALVQVVYAMNGNAPADSARDAIHSVIDFAWLQCAGMATDREGLS